MRSIEEIERDLALKEMEVLYWERFGSIPSKNELRGFADSQEV